MDVITHVLHGNLVLVAKVLNLQTSVHTVGVEVLQWLKQNDGTVESSHSTETLIQMTARFRVYRRLSVLHYHWPSLGTDISFSINPTFILFSSVPANYSSTMQHQCDPKPKRED